MRRSVLVAAVVSLAAAMQVAPASAATTSTTWPLVRFNAANTADNPAESTITAANVHVLRPQWVRRDATYTVPVLAGSGVVFGECGGRICALSASTGKPEWFANGSAQALSGGRLFSYQYFPGEVVALNANSGHWLWTRRLGQVEQVMTLTAPGNGFAYAGGDDGRLYALDVVTGKIRWTFADPNDTGANGTEGYWQASFPALSNGVLYVGANHDQSLYALDARTGQVKWHVIVPALNAFRPTVTKGLVLLGGNASATGYPNLVAYSIQRCASGPCVPAWSKHIDNDRALSPMAVANGIGYTVASQRVPTPSGSTDPPGTLYAFRVSDGTLLWKAPAAYAYSSPTVAGNVVYIGTSSGRVEAFAAGGCGAATCHRLWGSYVAGPRVQMDQITVVNGQLLTGGFGLYAFHLQPARTTPPAAPSPPTSVTAALSNMCDAVDVSWRAPARPGPYPVVSYTVTANDGIHRQDEDVYSGTMTDRIINLQRGRTYTFSFYARSAAGTSRAAVSNAVVPACTPSAPIDAHATAGNGTAHVTWSPPADDGGAPLTKYTVNTPNAIIEVPPTQTYADVTGLTNGATYTFTVTAWNQVGYGPGAQTNTVTPG